MRPIFLTLALALSPLALAGARVDLPATVQAALDDRWPGAEILESERDDDGYEVELRTADGEALEVELSEDGRILEVETDDDDDDRGPR